MKATEEIIVIGFISTFKTENNNEKDFETK